MSDNAVIDIKEVGISINEQMELAYSTRSDELFSEIIEAIQNTPYDPWQILQGDELESKTLVEIATHDEIDLYENGIVAPMFTNFLPDVRSINRRFEIKDGKVKSRKDKHTRDDKLNPYTVKSQLPEIGGFVDGETIALNVHRERKEYFNKLLTGDIEIIKYGFVPVNQSKFFGLDYILTEDNRAFVAINEFDTVEVDPYNFIQISRLDDQIMSIPVKELPGLKKLGQERKHYAKPKIHKKILHNKIDVRNALYEVAQGNRVEDYHLAKSVFEYKELLTGIEDTFRIEGINEAMIKAMVIEGNYFSKIRQHQINQDNNVGVYTMPAKRKATIVDQNQFKNNGVELVITNEDNRIKYEVANPFFGRQLV